MPIKTILSVLGIDQDATDLLRAAELADATDAHLNAAVVCCLPPAPFAEVVSPEFSEWSALWDTENERLSSRTAELRMASKDRGFDVVVEPLYCVNGAVAEQIGARAMYVDLTVVGPDLLADSGLAGKVVDGALFQSATPVLLVPKDVEPTLRPRTVMIAWNGGLEAAVAVRQSLELVTKAEDVHVVVIDSENGFKEASPKTELTLSHFLGRHGVQPTIHRLTSGGRAVDDILRNYSENMNADLLVMGAYGHSRLRERIFGGTTRSIIKRSSVPVFLAR